jgi:hypothetical protein
MWNSIRNTVTGLMEDDDTTQTAQERNLTRSTPQQRRVKADLRESPGKEGQEEGRLVNLTPVNLNKQSLERSVTDSIASGQSSLGRKKTDDYIKQRENYRLISIQRKMKITTHDVHIHAMAMLISFNLDFDIIELSVKSQILSDIQAIIASPMFDISPFYQKYNLDIILSILTIQETTSHRSKKELISLSKIVVQAVINKYLQPVEDISSLAWNDLCKMLGVFIPRN